VTDPARKEREPTLGAGRKLGQLAELPVSVLKGVGAAAERDLAELEVETVLDLVTHYPRRYIDGTRLVPIADLGVGDKASIQSGLAGQAVGGGNAGDVLRDRRLLPWRPATHQSDG
jgi:RecG-like helicase